MPNDSNNKNIFIPIIFALIAILAIVVVIFVLLIFVRNPKEDYVQEESSNQTAVDLESESTQKEKESEDVSSESAKAENKVDLKDVLREKLGLVQIADYCEADFDNDGVNEAFVIVGTDDGDGFVFGNIYFVTPDDVQMVLEDGSFYVYAEDRHLLEFDDVKFFLTGQYYATGDATYVYGVKDGKYYEDSISQSGMELAYYDHKKGTDLQIICSSYGNFTDGTGHTWKNYYLYWDDGFYEYGGIKISEDELLRCEGAKEIVDLIKDGGYSITDIFYRENNIININYTDQDINRNATLLLKGNQVRLKQVVDYGTEELDKSDFGGTYDAAFIPSIATYPEEFPVD